ncbi:MAG: efflux RND transporter periplasmic adaptor subunit [Thermodesulfovibrionales bacterium]
MRNRIAQIGLIFTLYILIFSFSVEAQEKKDGGMPPAKVVVGEVKTGTIAPENLFIGTVYYAEVSDIAAEVNGKVEKVEFEEGQRIKKAKVLVQLSSDILLKTLESTQASYDQVLADLENARREFNRIENLYKQESIAEQVYDEKRFRVMALERKGDSLKADVERLEIELEKKFIRSPYTGVVLKRNVDAGEWVSPGGVVATVARDDEIDVVVNVPQETVGYIKTGLSVEFSVGPQQFKGKVFAVVPRGDIATRTFPVKIRIKNKGYLKEGMEAKVKLPSGEKIKALIVPRDAVINVFGNDVVFAVVDNKAKMITVKVVGFKGLDAGVEAQGLQVGVQVVTKGHERLRNDQPVSIIGGEKKQ